MESPQLPSVFISYCHQDHDAVEKITTLFDRHGIPYWIDYKSIVLGRKYQGEIVRGIEQCHIFLFVYSEASNHSEDQLNEMSIAFKARKPIVPYILDNSTWSPELRYVAQDSQGIEVWKMGEDFAMKALLNGLLNTAHEPVAPASAVHVAERPAAPVPPEVDLDYDDALDYMAAGDLQAALHALQASLESGNELAAELLNKLLLLNFGQHDWDSQSWHFFDQQADAGRSFAHLAYFYKYQHSPADHPQAARHLRAALTDRKNGYAYLCEGLAKWRGIGLAKSGLSAMKRFEQARTLGVTEAASFMAEMYLSGTSGTGLDRQKAIDLLTEAAGQGDARSCLVLGQVYAVDAHLQENRVLAETYLRQAAEQHQPLAWIELGRLCLYDRFSDNGYADRAQHCYYEALKGGVVDAHAHIASLFWELGREEDALLEAQKGADAGGVLSHSTLARFCEEGLQTEGSWFKEKRPDLDRAWQNYHEAFALGGHIEDAIALARLYVRRNYRPDDGTTWEQIEEYLRQGAQTPVIEAIEMLADVLRQNGREAEALQYIKIGADYQSLPLMHEYGCRMLVANPGEALDYLSRAAQQHYQPSVQRLMDYFRDPHTGSKLDYWKWLTLAEALGMAVDAREFCDCLWETDRSRLWSWVRRQYDAGHADLLGPMANYVAQGLSVSPEEEQWLLGELRSLLFQTESPSREERFGVGFYDSYSTLLLRHGDTEAYDALLASVAQNPELLARLKLKREAPAKVLVADAEVSNVLLLKILLANEHYHVLTAATGEDLLRLATAERPDVVLLSSNVADPSWQQTFDQLKAHPQLSHVSVILVAHASETSIEFWKTAPEGIFDFVLKPFTKEELLHRVRSAADMARLCHRLPPEAFSFAKEKKRILVVDDVAFNVLLTRILFTRQGYQVLTASNGAEAMVMAEEQHPDLILLDIMMPDISGYTVCEVLKENDTTRHIPIMFLTALCSTDDAARGFSLGASEYISKPFNAAELLLRVEKTLRQSQAMQYFEG